MEKANNIRFWNKISRVYDIFMRKNTKAYEEMYKLMSEKLTSDMRVLELATGTGLIAINVASKVKEIIATDYSKDMIDIARKKTHSANIHFEVMDACDLKYEENSFDVVIMSNALHVIPEPKLALQNIARVLKRRGIIIVPTFTSMTKSKNLIVRRIMELGGFKVYSQWDLDGYSNFLESNGVKIERKEIIKATFDLMYVEGNF